MDGSSVWTGNEKGVLQQTLVASTGGGDETLTGSSIRETTLQGTFQARLATSRIRIRIRSRRTDVKGDNTSIADRTGAAYVSMDSSAGAGNAHNGTLKGSPTALVYGRAIRAASTASAVALVHDFSWEFIAPDAGSHTYTFCLAGGTANTVTVYSNSDTVRATMEITEEEP